ncbi:SDR family NAD(P)-dependent oxidoreductase [Nocardia carnea]|uniref:SDR family NAD(P)-dependent oxidoreductase n=1 Tax=Nocardia carnea TaxID=37328 RepID=UPI002456A819|nr:SDR family oxidoreductase [Nocardia carnea]
MRFDGKRVFVTGAASGIGAATLALFRKEGAKVVGVDVTPGADLMHCDVADPASVQQAIDASVDRLGGLDVLVNVAGISSLRKLEDETFERWQQIMGVNATGPMLLTKAALPHLRASRGNIVTVASISALQGQPYLSAYCASKGAVLQFMKSMAVELAADHIRVNCVCPGGVGALPSAEEAQGEVPAALENLADVDLTLLTRLNGVLPGITEQDDIAEAIAWLASDAARSVSGVALRVDRATLWQ